MHRDRFPEDERPGFSSFAAGRSSHGFSSAGAAVPNASRQRMLAGRSLPRGMFRSLSDRIGYGAQEGTVRAASDECAALPSNTAGLSPMRGPLLSRFFGCPGAAARISPRARTFPPRCRTAGPCAFLTEGRSGRSLRNAPRGRDLRRRINRGPHGSEEPQSAAAFRTDRTLCPAGKRYRRDRYETIPRGFRNDRAKLRNKTRAAPNRPGTNPQRFRRNPETFTKSACNASGGKSGSSRGTAAEHRPVKRQNRPVRSPFNYILSKIIVRCE